MMVRRPNMHSIKVFVTVANLASFTRAANDLHISQPALTRTVQGLEEQLGARLFERTSRTVRLTKEGEAFRPIAIEILNGYERAFDEIDAIFSGKRGRVIVGTLPSFAAITLPLLISRFKASHPDIEIVVKDSLSGDIERSFANREIDLAVIAKPNFANFLTFTPILEEEFGLVCRDDDELAGARSVDWSVFGTHSFIAMSPLSSVRRSSDAGMAIAGLEVRPLFECAHLATVGRMIEAGLGVSALPRSVLPLLTHQGLAWIRLVQPVVTRQIGLATHSHRSLSPAGESFARYLLKDTEYNNVV